MACSQICREHVPQFVKKTWSRATRQKKLESNVLSTALRRCLSTADLVFIGIGHMMGSGIYVLTGTAMAMFTGPSTALAYILAGFASTLNSICYIQFSVNIPKAGTVYNYVYVVSGEIWGFLAGWNIILEYLILVSSIGRSLSDAIDSTSGGVLTNASIAIFGRVNSNIFGQPDILGPWLILAFFTLVAVGVRSTVNVNNVLAVINVAVILIATVAGFIIGSPENISTTNVPFMPFGISGFLSGTGLLFFGYVGYDAVAIAAEETKNPSKSMPIAVCISMAVVIILYSSSALALSFLVPYYMVNLVVPFPAAFSGYGVTWIKYVVTFGSMSTISTSLLAQAFCLPRGIYAMACDGLLFTPLRYVNTWTQTPLVAIGTAAIFAALITMMFDVPQLAEMVSIGTLFAMILMGASLLKLHYLPADLCPFALGPKPDENGAGIKDNSPEVSEENRPILNKKPTQQLKNIGLLRFNIPWLQRIESNTATTALVCAVTISNVALALLLALGWPYIVAGDWWAILFVIVLIIIYISCICLLLMYEHNRSFSKFQVPFFPWLVLVSIFVNLVLIMSLKFLTWMRLLVWIAVGLLLYFAYGIRHSTMERSDEYIQMDTPAEQHDDLTDSQ